MPPTQILPPNQQKDWEGAGKGGRQASGGRMQIPRQTGKPTDLTQRLGRPLRLMVEQGRTAAHGVGSGVLPGRRDTASKSLSQGCKCPLRAGSGEQAGVFLSFLVT